ncbi:MAG TPA: PAS domain S-box protein, partial [Roseiflexaceae bacterium]|nr:PAS domain S-box protein [Roseiflexaceae bacterium]
MSVPLHVLLLEDRAADALLALQQLRRAGFAPEWRRVESEEAYLAALDPSLDVILADYHLPQFDALRALELLRARELDIPFIVVSGTIGEDIAVQIMRRGAADYLLKDRLARLGAAVERALQQRQLRVEKEKAEAALHHHAHLHQVVLSSLTAEIAVLDPSGSIIAVNAAWEHFARRQGDPHLNATGIGINYLDVCRRAAEQSHDTEAAHVLAGLQAILDGEREQFTTEYSCATPEGDLWFIMHATPLPKRTGIVIAHEDISARKQVEQALRATETKYRTLVEHIPAIVYQAAIDPSSSTLYVNEQIEKILGFSQNDWMADPQRWLKQLHPQDLDHVLGTIARAHSSDAPIRSEFRMLTRDGRVVWFGDEAVVIRDWDGQPLFLQGIMLDITARKQAEEQLHELNANLEQRVAKRTADLARANAQLQAKVAEQAQLEQQIQRHAGQAFAAADISRMLAEASLNLQPLFDMIAHQITRLIGDAAVLTLLSDDRQTMEVVSIGHRDPEAVAFLRLLFPEPYPANQGIAGQVARTGQAVLVPVIAPEQARAQVKPEYRPYLDRFGMSSVVIVPLRARGRILGTIGISRDKPGQPYTEQDREFLQDLADRAGLAIDNAQLFTSEQQARAEAERANRAKSAFLASMSHELRTPLNAILGFTGTLLMKLPGPLNADQERQLTTVQRSGKHLLNLINDLLDLAKIEAGKVEIAREALICQHVLDEAAGSLRALAEEKGLRFSIIAPAKRLVVHSDRRALGQILLNLIGNAIKFT